MPLTKIQSLGITDGTIVNADINASAAIASTKLSGSFGITEADVFRLTTPFSGDATPIASNWERADDASSGLLGTGMTQSSGVFTFPSTGIYHVTFIHNFYSTSDDRAISNAISVSTDGGSTFDKTSESFGFLKNVSPGSNNVDSATASCLIDVTSTANVKVRFEVAKLSSSSPNTFGDSGLNSVFVTFIRLGDT
jgi:hypothetical protein